MKEDLHGLEGKKRVRTHKTVKDFNYYKGELTLFLSRNAQKMYTVISKIMAPLDEEGFNRLVLLAYGNNSDIVSSEDRNLDQLVLIEECIPNVRL